MPTVLKTFLQKLIRAWLLFPDGNCRQGATSGDAKNQPPAFRFHLKQEIILELVLAD